MKTIALALLMLICLLLFTACHTNTDPWPVSEALLSPGVTSVPTQQATAAPSPTEAPTSTPAAVPTPEPSDIPNSGDDPGING